jgi:hypothetical protein
MATQIQFFGGKILFKTSGTIAMNDECCCGCDDCTCTACDPVPETWSLTVPDDWRHDLDCGTAAGQQDTCDTYLKRVPVGSYTLDYEGSGINLSCGEGTSGDCTWRYPAHPGDIDDMGRPEPGSCDTSWWMFLTINTITNAIKFMICQYDLYDPSDEWGYSWSGDLDDYYGDCWASNITLTPNPGYDVPPCCPSADCANNLSDIVITAG